ncbi:MAG: DUF4153 domain-containing protein [Thalassotalea sp.]
MDNQLPKPLIILISLLQGILLTLLYQSVEHKIWPGTEPVWLVSLATFAISYPLLTLLAITKTNGLTSVKYLLPFTLLLSVLGAYVGFQQEPTAFVDNSSVIFVFSFTALIAAFKALMYIQQYLSNEAISYSSLFKLSWRNFIIFAECWLFVLIFWGILNLGAGLFAVLEIDFFKALLKKDWFVIPVLTLAFGFSIIVFRNIIHTADNISTILQTLIKFLLPALTIVSLGFLATLPFTGLDTLWKTGSGSLLVMWLQALTLFFINTVYQYAAHERPYHHLLHRLIFIGVAILPIYSMISAYGLWLRVEQYGLSVDRCWALLICVLLACFSFGYLFGIVKKRDAWLTTLSKVNISMGIVVLLAMLLVNSPLLNFQSISAASQLARLDAGKTSYAKFDYKYFDRTLGRQGYLALQALKPKLKVHAPEQIVMIDRMYINHQKIDREALSVEDFLQFIEFWPNKSEFPKALISAVYKRETKSKWSTYRGKNYYFIAKDLNDDGKVNYVVIEENNSSTSASLWLLDDEQQWSAKYMQTSNPNKNHLMKDLLLTDQVEVISPTWKNLKVGDITFRAPIE